jgi:arsenate reductase-like glutaredoxin family protein
MIENQPNELTLIYHSDKADDKKARAFIETITDYVIKTLDLKRECLTETQLAEIAGKMDVGIELLIDTSYKDSFTGADPESISDVSDADLLTLLTQIPILIKTPIAIIGKRAYQYTSSNDLLISATIQKELPRHGHY